VYEVMAWFQRSIAHQLYPPPTPTNTGPTFHPPTHPPPSGVDTQLEHRPAEPRTLYIVSPSRQDSAGFHEALPNQGNLPAGSPPDGSPLPISQVPLVGIPSPPPPDNPPPPELSAAPKLFEHDVNRPIIFCVPIDLRERGTLAEIFRIRFTPPLSVSLPHVMYSVGYERWIYR